MIAKRNIIPVFVPHLGCPNNCVFCNQRKISGSLVPASADIVIKTINEGIGKIPEKTNIQLAFYGGSFTAIPVSEQIELLNAALPFLRNGNISSLRISTRPDAIDEDVLCRLKSFGVKTIELGTQSMCNDVLKASGRGHTSMHTEKAANIIKQFGFELILQMMTGLPEDTMEKAIETANKIISLEPDGVRIYPTVIIEDTPLHDMWLKGLYCEHSVYEAVNWCSKILPMFENAGIPVIRLGLNPTEELSCGAAVAGAYHPAFGELVQSKILLDKARLLIKNRPQRDEIIIGVNKTDISAMIGQRRSNIEILSREYCLKNIKVKQVDIKRGNVILI